MLLYCILVNLEIAFYTSHERYSCIMQSIRSFYEPTFNHSIYRIYKVLFVAIKTVVD